MGRRRLSNTVAGVGRPTMGSVSGDMNNAAMNIMANSGPSSSVNDANSALSSGPRSQRSASVNAESYTRLPAAPTSFTWNDVGISGSSTVDGPPVATRNSRQEQTELFMQQWPLSSLSLPASENGQLPQNIQDPGSLSRLRKKPCLDIKQEDVIPQHVHQNFCHRQDSMQLQVLTPQSQSLLPPPQQILPSMPSAQSVYLQDQQQLRHQPQLQDLPQMNATKLPFDRAICSRRLMQYLYHRRQYPAESSIAYWRNFVAEYYAPSAKKRWCLSLYGNGGQPAPGVFPRAAADAWKCDICGAKCGRGFEATYEVLPRLNEFKFRSGVVDELLFLDSPREYRFPSGIMILEYSKAVEESVYEQLRVVMEGKLRIVFAQDLKILSWEFCARRHEELLPRRLVAPQVNRLVQVAQKCQTTITESGADRVYHQDLQTNSNMVLTASRQLAKSLDLQSLNELGLSKQHVRCLQISDVVNSMKDLVDFCWENKTGPAEALKSYTPRMAPAELPAQEIEQGANAQSLPSDRSTINKLMALHPGLNDQGSSNQLAGNRQVLTGSAQAASALPNTQSMFRRRNSTNLIPGPSSSAQGNIASARHNAGFDRNTSAPQAAPRQVSWGHTRDLQRFREASRWESTATNGGTDERSPEVSRGHTSQDISIAKV